MIYRKAHQYLIAALVLAVTGLFAVADATGNATEANTLDSQNIAGSTDGSTVSKSTAATTIRVTDDVVRTVTKRMGVNLGGPESWGASQYMKNILPNPGFESGEYGMMFHVGPNSTPGRVEQDFWYTEWNNDTYNVGQPVGFWDGAEYEVVFGPSKGHTGTVSKFTHENNRYTWYLTPQAAQINQWDVLIARKEFKQSFGSPNPSSQADVTTTRPGSTGKQSFHAVYPAGAGWAPPFYAAHFDSYWRDGDKSSGKLLKVQGTWKLKFWAKGKNSGDQLRARFFREGEIDFLNHTVLLTNTWQQYEVSANIPDTADKLGPYAEGVYHPLLSLTFSILNQGGEVWIDDCELYKDGQTNPTAFTDTFVNLLKELRPGVLRDWRIQCGVSLDNELSDPFGRKLSGFRPGARAANAYGYSLHEFLEICREIDAEPWYVISPTFSQKDLTNLAAYLGAPVSSGHPYALRRQALGQSEPWTTVFDKIHLEYGNEMWGAASGSDPFFGASALGGVRLGSISHYRFGFITGSPYFDDARFNLIIGGQSAFPGRQGEIEANSSNHDSVAVAPYFGGLDQWPDDASTYYPMFALALNGYNGIVADSQSYLDASGKGTEMSIYEINLHTTHGPSPLDVRNRFVASLGAGLSLPLTMLSYQRDLGINNQCAFTAVGYSFKFGWGTQDYVRLWGMMRDLEATGRKRPTWLGVELANKAILSSMITTSYEGVVPSVPVPAINGLKTTVSLPVLQSFAYKDGDSYGLVLFNLDLVQSHAVTLSLPNEPVGGASVTTLNAADINASNEEALNVTATESFLADFASTYTMSLPAHSMVTLTWNGSDGIVVTPDPVVFDDTNVRGKSGKEISVRNNGKKKSGVTILAIVPVSGDVYDFKLATALSNQPLVSGQEIELIMEFTPTSAGKKSARFDVMCDDSATPCIEIVLTGRALPDSDEDGVEDSLDAFPDNSDEWEDADEDGLGDNFENQIIQQAQNDSDPLNNWITSLADVNAADDFDGDGSSNLTEFLYGGDALDPSKSVPLGGAWFLTMLLAVMGLLMRRTYQYVYVK